MIHSGRFAFVMNKTEHTSAEQGFSKELIAPCGMNCGTCLAYLRSKNHCYGCRGMDEHKSRYIRKCIIRNCSLLAEKKSGFCYACEKYPCRRLKQLDNRYRTRYQTSLIENLEYIRDEGMDSFLSREFEKWHCQGCGGTICIHRGYCLHCTG